jgi:hypothetical protein
LRRAEEIENDWLANFFEKCKLFSDKEKLVVEAEGFWIMSWASGLNGVICPPVHGKLPQTNENG